MTSTTAPHAPPTVSAAARTAGSRTCWPCSPSRTDVAGYPHADRVEQGVLVYEAERGAPAARRPPRRRRPCGPSSPTRSPTGPASSCSPAPSTPTSSTGSPRCSSGSSPTRRPPGGPPATTSRSPARTTGCGTPWRRLAVADPEAFVAYYANDILALAATAWLGPGYQVTSQVNVVNPGGAGQTVHRDYHLGFQSPEVTGRYPGRVHDVSPLLTLQGAVAHCDMPVETGPDALPPAQPEVLARLPRLLAAGVPGVLRRPPRAAAAAPRGCGVLQPRALPRGRLQPHGRRAPDGQPAADLVGLRPRDGDRRPRPRRRARSTRRCSPPRTPGCRPPTSTPSSPRPRRATPSRPTSTATRRSTG